MKFKDAKNKEEIYNFIEQELRCNNSPIFAEITRKIFEIFDVYVYPTKIGEICKKISEEKNIQLNLKDNHYSPSYKKAKLLEIYQEAEASGITDEEIYLCKINGYPYGLMSRVYFELTGNLIDTKYFIAKYARYCKEHNIPINKNAHKLDESNSTIAITDLNNHSNFFRQILLEKKNSFSSSKRREASKKLNDPYKKLHDERKRVENNISHDER